MRGSYDGMVELGSREEEVDIFCLQEVAVGVEREVLRVGRV